jgi:hypothetical protein
MSDAMLFIESDNDMKNRVWARCHMEQCSGVFPYFNLSKFSCKLRSTTWPCAGIAPARIAFDKPTTTNFTENKVLPAAAASSLPHSSAALMTASDSALVSQVVRTPASAELSKPAKHLYKTFDASRLPSVKIPSNCDSSAPASACSMSFDESPDESPVLLGAFFVSAAL